MISPLQILLEKPWQPQPDRPAPAPASNREDAAQTALRFFIAVVGVLFSLLAITFISRSQYPDFQPLAGQPWQPLTDTTQLWFNSTLLALASLAMHWGLRQAQRGRIGRAVGAASAGVCLSVCFLLAQLALWQTLMAMGFTIAATPASSYFYLLSATHGLHLAGGLLALAPVGLQVWRGAGARQLIGPLRLATRYWHFLLAVWLALFALLTCQPDTLNALAALCGF